MTFDNTFFAFVALVLFLGIVFWAGAHRKAGAALDARRDQIAKDIADARKLREEAEALLAEYKQKRLDAEKEAKSIVEAARADAAAFAEEAKAKLADMVERRSKQAEDKIARAEAAATKDIRDKVADIAIEKASGLLGAKAKGKGGDGLIASSIEALRTQLN